MTVPLSAQKVSKILKGYFAGMSQAEIAEKAGVDQSTVSIYSSRFRKRASQVGLLAAGREFGVFNEVDALRSLSVELSQAGLTVEEAKEGLRILKMFMKLGISSEQHAALVKVCNEIDDPGFVQAALKLSALEARTNMSYDEVISSFERVSSELLSSEKKLIEVQINLKSVSNSLASKKQERVSLEAHLAKLKNETLTQEAQLRQELSIKIKQSKVKQTEVEEVSKLKAQLSQQGLDISALVKLAKEFTDDD